METMVNAMELFEDLKVALNNLGDMELPFACMLLDYLAAKQGQGTVEFMDYIRPVIIEVNEQFEGNTVGIL